MMKDEAYNISKTGKCCYINVFFPNKDKFESFICNTVDYKSRDYFK